MRKSVLIVSLAFATLSAFAQTHVFTTPWEVLATATAGDLISTGATNSTVAYNPIKDRLYVADRNNKISVVDPATGLVTAPSSLSTIEVTAESYKYTKIRVTSDGVIYACGMVLKPTAPATTATLKIYRWENEAADKPSHITLTVTERTGDSFAVSGSGVNTVLYVSGSASNKIYVMTTSNGKDFTNSKIITLSAAGDARTSISAVTTGAESDLFINAISGVVLKKITSNSAGVVNATVTLSNATYLSNIFGNTEYFEQGAAKFLAMSGANDATIGLTFKVVNITDIASPTLVAEKALTKSPYVANSNGYADVAIKNNGDNTFTFFHLVMGNGLAAYKSATVLPVSLTSFDASLKNAQSTLSWSTSSELNNKGFEIQRSIDGKDFVTIAFEDSKATNGNSSAVIHYSFVDKSAFNGVNYYRLKQVDLNGQSQLHEVKSVKVGVAESTIEVYPNPATSFVKVKAADFKRLEYKIYNVLGRELISEKAMSLETEISTDNLQQAIYILKVLKNGEEIRSVKIMKH